MNFEVINLYILFHFYTNKCNNKYNALLFKNTGLLQPITSTQNTSVTGSRLHKVRNYT